MLSPAKVKFRKMQKGRMRGTAQRGAKVSFGDYGLMALEPGLITQRQIEAARIAMTRYVKRSGRETMVAVRVWWRHGHQRCVDLVSFRSVWSVWCGLCPSPHPSPPPSLLFDLPLSE